MILREKVSRDQGEKTTRKNVSKKRKERRSERGVLYIYPST